MRIAILDLCEAEPAFAHHGTVGEIVIRWLAPRLPEATFETIHIHGGAAFPAPEAFDGYALTGSEKGVYDETAWMDPLRDFIRRLRDRRIPMFGMCFGHQIMADALGGRAEKRDLGFVIGARDFLIEGRPAQAHVMHQDQVTAVPPGAEVIVTADYCPIAGLRYDFPALSVQFHPEYDRGFVMDGLDILAETFMTKADEAAGRASMEGSAVAEDLWAAETAAFFRAAIADGRGAADAAG